jgi:two-component system response regulator ChvI
MPDRQPLVAVVDDEAHLRKTLSQALVREGYAVEVFADGVEAWKRFGESLPDLVILDILMPRMDGLELCRRIRSASRSVPVIFLTSRDEEFDRVLGLELGGDDYLCKPFSLRELVARVRVLFRRAGLAAPSPAPSARDPAADPLQAQRVAAGSLAMDGERFTASWNGTPVRLTVTEFRMLAALAGSPGYVRSREELLHAAFPQDSYMSDRSVDCHIKRLRKKLADTDPGFDGIETIYGLGYRWREAGQA